MGVKWQEFFTHSLSLKVVILLHIEENILIQYNRSLNEDTVDIVILHILICIIIEQMNYNYIEVATYDNN